MGINEETYFHRRAKQTREGGGVMLFYRWDSATGMSPASGYIRFNTGFHTEMAIHETDRDGVDQATFLDEFGQNYVMIRSQENPERYWFGSFYQLYWDDGASRRYSIETLAENGTLDDNEYVTVTFSHMPYVSGITFNYLFNSDLLMIDPTAGYVAFNAGTSYIKISETDADGVDLSDVFDEIVADSYVMLRMKRKTDAWVMLKIDQDGVSQTGWRYWHVERLAHCNQTDIILDSEVWLSFQFGIPEEEEETLEHVHTFQEDHSAECDGAKTNFLTANQFEEDTLNVFLNGALQRVGLLKDYTEDWPYDNFTMAAAPSGGDTLVVEYLVEQIE